MAECEAKTGNNKNDISLKGNADTSVILEAVANIRQSLEKKIDIIDKNNKDTVDKMQIEFDNIQSESNQRMEG